MKRALVIVDMIEDFVHEGGALYCGPSMARIVPVIQHEIARSRAAAEPVVYLTDNHLPGDAEFQMFPPHALAGTKGAEIVPELAPSKDDVVIPKRRYSGFFGTDLDITLRERAVDTLRLVGDCTNICVLYTAADARNLVSVARAGAVAVAMIASPSSPRVRATNRSYSAPPSRDTAVSRKRLVRRGPG